MSAETGDDRLIVTSENFGELLIQAAEEALAYAKGDKTKGRLVRRIVPDIPAPPAPIDAADIPLLRRRFGLRQQDLARVLNVSDKTVKAWEQGINTPSGAALRLLQIVAEHPEVVLGAGTRSRAAIGGRPSAPRRRSG